MDTLSKEENLAQVSSYFKNLLDSSATIIMWQQQFSGERTVQKGVIDSVVEDEESVFVLSENDRDFNFNSNPIFFYVDDKNTLFKVVSKSCQSNLLEIHFPANIKELSADQQDGLKAVLISMGVDYNYKTKGTFKSDEISEGESAYEFAKEKDIKEANIVIDNEPENLFNLSDADSALFEKELSFVSLDEEDKKFEGMRESPRARIPEGKMVTIEALEGNGIQSTYSLHDLSRGGLAFLVFSGSEFKVDQVLLIKAFDVNKFEVPMHGIVRVVKEADEMGIQFKVGIQFIPPEIN